MHVNLIDPYESYTYESHSELAFLICITSAVFNSDTLRPAAVQKSDSPKMCTSDVPE